MVQYRGLDDGFAALADETRRGVLVELGRGAASITDLAMQFDMTLTGMKKHVQILEDANLVATEKIGRTRVCRLGKRRLERELQFIAAYQQMLEQRLDSLAAFLERTKNDDDRNDKSSADKSGDKSDDDRNDKSKKKE